MKKAIIVSINDKYNYPLRTKHLEKILSDKEYDVEIVTSNFDHRTKKQYREQRENLIKLKTISYYKNISIRRILSLFEFSAKAFLYVNKVDPDLVYISGPPNTLFWLFSVYKKQHDEKIVIAEVGDMWPESLPFNESLKKKISYPISIWRNLRDKHIWRFDRIITECNLFKYALEEVDSRAKVNTVYFCQPYVLDRPYLDPGFEQQYIRIGYLGSVNNIIDTDFIVDLLIAISKKRKLVFEIIAAGEKKQFLINKLKDNEVSVIDYGTIYDQHELSEIIKKWTFGLNIMKTEVCVGMTMKSMQYIQNYIPIINNIGGDIFQIVEKYNIGYNVDRKNLSTVAEAIENLDAQEYSKMSENVFSLFKNVFSVQAFEERIEMLKVLPSD